MAISLRDTASSCLGTSSPSVLNNVFGYYWPPSQILSLKRQLELDRGEAININVILVAESTFTSADITKIQYALQFTRQIYDDVNIGIRKIRWQAIPTSDAGSYATIDSGGEACDLTDDWNGSGSDYLDVFVVRVINGADGWSEVDGPCSKNHSTEMTGSVVSLNGNNNNTGNTFAHEIAHYLKLEHISSSNNFIGNNGSSNSNTSITASQGNKMKSHCYCKDKC